MSLRAFVLSVASVGVISCGGGGDNPPGLLPPTDTGTSDITPGAITSPDVITAEMFGCIDSVFFDQLAQTRTGVVSRLITTNGSSCTWDVTMIINNDPGVSCRLTGEISYVPESTEPSSIGSVCAQIDNARLELSFVETVRNVEPIPVPIDLAIRFPVSLPSVNENGQSLNHPFPIGTHLQTVDQDFNTTFDNQVFSVPEE